MHDETIYREVRDSDGWWGVCPACRKHAEIGRRVEGMKPKPQVGLVDDWREGWNDCLWEAKGEGK